MVIVFPIAWEWPEVKRAKSLVGLRYKMSEWLTCLLRVLLLMCMSLFDMFRRFHFLKVTKVVESLIVASLIACLSRQDGCLGGPGRRGCYRLVSERGCALLGWRCSIMHACQLNVCLLHLHSMWLLHCIMVIIIVERLSWGAWCDFMECIFSSIWLVSYDYMSLDYILGWQVHFWMF